MWQSQKRVVDRSRASRAGCWLVNTSVRPKPVSSTSIPISVEPNGFWCPTRQ